MHEFRAAPYRARTRGFAQYEAKAAQYEAKAAQYEAKAAQYEAKVAPRKIPVVLDPVK